MTNNKLRCTLPGKKNFLELLQDVALLAGQLAGRGDVAGVGGSDQGPDQLEDVQHVGNLFKGI